MRVRRTGDDVSVWNLVATEGASSRVGWVYLDGPGAVSIVSGTPRGESSQEGRLRPTTLAEQLVRLKEHSFRDAALAIWLLRGPAFLLLLLVSIVITRICAARLLEYVPEGERALAAEEINQLLRVAKWGGVVTLSLLTLIDNAELLVVLREHLSRLVPP